MSKKAIIFTISEEPLECSQHDLKRISEKINEVSLEKEKESSQQELQNISYKTQTLIPQKSDSIIILPLPQPQSTDSSPQQLLLTPAPRSSIRKQTLKH